MVELLTVHVRSARELHANFILEFRGSVRGMKGTEWKKFPLAEAEPPWPAVHPVATNVEVRTKVAAADVLGVEERHIACEKMCVTSRDIFASYFSVCFLLAFSGSKMIKT